MNPLRRTTPHVVFNAAHDRAYAHTLKAVTRALQRVDHADHDQAVMPTAIVDNVKPDMSRIERMAEGGPVFLFFARFMRLDSVERAQIARFKKLWLAGMVQGRDVALADAWRAVMVASHEVATMEWSPADVVRRMPKTWPGLQRPSVPDFARQHLA